MVSKIIKSVLAFVIMLSLCLGILHPITAQADSLYIIRVGLTEQLKQQSSVKISTTKIALGYCINNRFSEYIHFENPKGFTVKPATGYYLVSDTVFSDYASVKAQYDKARKIPGIKKYVKICMLGKNKWGIYVGGLTSVSTVSGWRMSLENKLSTTFGSVTSYNGHRVLITGGAVNLMYDGADTGQYLQIAPNVLNKKGSKTLTLNGHEYRGRVEIGPYGGTKLTVVNIINVENYLRSVVGSVMKSSDPEEALRAQAIASRTYALNHCDNMGDTDTTNPYAINDTSAYQQYGGYGKETAKCVNAVVDTRGICMYADGALINSRFHLSSGGETETAANLWGTKESYLVSVADVDDLKYGGAAWNVSYTASELGDLLGCGDVKTVRLDSVSEAGRILEMTVEGEKSSVTISGDNVRKKLGLKSAKCKMITSDQPAKSAVITNGTDTVTVDSLASCNAIGANGEVKSLNNGLFQFVVAGVKHVTNYLAGDVTADKTFLFAGMGEGDGVGMSQAGARALAGKGYGCEYILRHYFGENITIK